jgi:RNA polymerase sigma-70 factor (ECF subfamily)
VTVKAFIFDMKDESRLIHLAKTANSEKAFTALVKHHQGKVRAFLFRLCGSASLADDMGQDTFILAYQKLYSFQGESKFSTWLLAIAYRCFLQALRKSP